MKYLHIIPMDRALIMPLVQMLNKYDKENQHEYMVTVTFASVLKNNPRMLCIRALDYIPAYKKGGNLRRMAYLLKRCRQADRVVWHSFRTNGGYNPFLLFLDRKVLRKSIWLPADGEIGNYMNVANKLLNHFTARVNRYVQTHISAVGVSFPSDIEVLVEQGVERERIACLPYPIPWERVELLRKASENTAEPTDRKTGFQIGLSSQAGNHHWQVIKRVVGLTQYRGARAFIPLQFSVFHTPAPTGTKIYQKQLRKQAKKLVCETVYLERPVSAEIFMEQLQQIDAAFLANNTACRTEFLLHLLAAGKKVFLPQDSQLYRYLNSAGANIQPLEELERGRTLQEVLDCPAACLPDALADFYDSEVVAERWVRYFAPQK